MTSENNIHSCDLDEQIFLCVQWNFIDENDGVIIFHLWPFFSSFSVHWRNKNRKNKYLFLQKLLNSNLDYFEINYIFSISLIKTNGQNKNI